MFDSMLETQKWAANTKTLKMFTTYEYKTLSYLFNILYNMREDYINTFVLNSRDKMVFFFCLFLFFFSFFFFLVDLFFQVTHV